MIFLEQSMAKLFANGKMGCKLSILANSVKQHNTFVHSLAGKRAAFHPVSLPILALKKNLTHAKNKTKKASYA